MKNTFFFDSLAKKRIFNLFKKSQFFILVPLCEKNIRRIIFNEIQLSLKDYKIIRIISGNYTKLSCFDSRREEYLLMHITLDRKCVSEGIYPEPNTELANLCMGNIKVYSSIRKTRLIIETMFSNCTDFSINLFD